MRKKIFNIIRRREFSGPTGGPLVTQLGERQDKLAKDRR
jgi:hypothetical protein